MLHDEVVKEAETAAVEAEAVDFPEVDADRKDEATLRDFVAEEVLVPARERALPTGWRVDRFPQDPGRMRLVSTPPWSLRPPTCEPELWLIIGKPAQREMRAKWQPTILMHLPRKWCGRLRSRVWGWRATWSVLLVMDTPVYRVPLQFRQNDDPVVSSDGGVLAQRARRRDCLR